MPYQPLRLVSLVSLVVEVVKISSFTLKPFFGERPRPSKLVAGKDGSINPNQTCHYCKDTRHLLENCLRLKARNKFVAEHERKEKEGLN